MAHEITNTDNLFSVREKTWHGLGQVLTDYPTREEAQAIAHPWEPISEPIYLGEPDFGTDPLSGEYAPTTRYAEAPGYKALRRSDNGHLLGVVSDTYTPVNNDEMWDIAEAIQGGDAEVRYETGGSLRGGAQVWLLIRLNEPLTVNGDPHGATIPYYSLQNAHDGSGAFRGQATMTRIVCANTSHIADVDARARGTEFRFNHTLNVRDRIEQAKDALAGWRAGLADWQLMQEDLLDRRFHGTEALDFLNAFIPEPAAEIVSERVRANVANERAKWEEIYRSVTCEGITDTAYGLVAASVEYAEHARTARSQETRFKRAYLDRNSIVSTASRIAKELVSA